jgi:hypothetical protein
LSEATAQQAEAPSARQGSPAARVGNLARRFGPLVAVAGTCVVSLVMLRAELVQVPYLNDSAVHEEMVRFALAKIRGGHFPPDSWFPFLNLGTPQYLQYQSLGAMLTALAAWAVGVGRAFTLTTWLLVSAWPVCIYASARIFGLRREAALGAAVLSPFVSSFTGVGFEQISYLWSGYGLWSQLWAMWALPFAWALSWRAVDERRFVVPAALLVAATAAFHFETGYLAFAALAVFVLARPGELWRRCGRGLLVAGGAAALSAWAIVPLVAQGRWAAVNQFLQSGPSGVDANSYGAGRALSALFDGSIFDWHHLALITPLFGLGFLLCLVRWRERDSTGPVPAATGRALVLVFLSCLILFFGRPALGPLLDALPGAKDLFLRRFIVGVQLSGLFLAGAGAAALARFVVAGARWLGHLASLEDRRGALVGRFALICLIVATLVPAWSFLSDQADLNASFVSRQSAAGPGEIDSLLAVVEKKAGGRVFAGDPSDWGSSLTVGEVPVFKYLAAYDIDEVGFTLRTASLMSDPEVGFDEYNPADYAAFGISWLLLPAAMRPPVPATFVSRRGPYALWHLSGNGYVQLVDTRGSVAANSGDLGSFSASLLAGLSSTDPLYPTVAYDSGPAAPGTLPYGFTPSGPPGRVLSQSADLEAGTVAAKLLATRPCTVLLSVSYNPGWQALLDGRPVATEMVAPALVGVDVPAGEHTIRFVYKGFPDYPQLFVLAGCALVALVVLERRRRSRALGSDL